MTWRSPTAGDIYGSGQAISAAWDAQKEIVQPSFRMCFNSSAGSKSESKRSVEASDGDEKKDSGTEGKTGEDADNEEDDGPNCGEPVTATVHGNAGSYSVTL